MGASQGIGGPTISKSNQPKPFLFENMQKMTQIMSNIQPASSSEASRPPAFFYGTKTFKVISFIQSCQLIFQNDAEDFSEEKKKIIYATQFLTCRDEKWIETYISNLTNPHPAYLLNNLALLKSQIVSLFGA
ncbi:hypothetical protein O181_024954 [Austropuccinia psidii MF-1]|uniref:Uncharacterized protein n=1 Tax=Austropuccinia psidii MF-1 TaxID=1389203 RepID=A0A9Q3CJM1_9BASI|nr:hypothetical protein [Austropuccinia psidii MF-1]